MDENETFWYRMLLKKEGPFFTFPSKSHFRHFWHFFLFWPISSFLWSTIWYLFIRTQTYNFLNSLHIIGERYYGILGYTEGYWNINHISFEFHQMKTLHSMTERMQSKQNIHSHKSIKECKSYFSEVWKYYCLLKVNLFKLIRIVADCAV